MRFANMNKNANINKKQVLQALANTRTQTPTQTLKNQATIWKHNDQGRDNYTNINKRKKIVKTLTNIDTHMNTPTHKQKNTYNQAPT